MVARLPLYFEFTVAPTQGKIRNNTVAVFVAIPFLAPSGKKQWDPVMVFDARLVQIVDAILRLQGFLAKKINSSLSYDCQFFWPYLVFVPCRRKVLLLTPSLNKQWDRVVVFDACLVRIVDAIVRLQGFLANVPFFFALACLQVVVRL